MKHNVSYASHTLTVALLVGGAAMASARASMAYEEPRFAVIDSTDAYEIRAYEAHLVAEVAVEGEYEAAGSAAFRILAAYIFGNNADSLTMAMTVPVSITPVHDRAQLSVVTVDKSEVGNGRYIYRFVIERQYTAATLPPPKDQRITIREIEARTMAVRRYSGRATEGNHRRNLATLQAALDRDGRRVRGEPEFAVYNGPFTLPFLRRNEVVLDLIPNAPMNPDSRMPRT
jgi:SOUL heme-binding protein